MKVMSEQNIHLDWQSLYWVPNICQSYATGYVEEVINEVHDLNGQEKWQILALGFVLTLGVTKDLPNLLA